MQPDATGGSPWGLLRRQSGKTWGCSRNIVRRFIYPNFDPRTRQGQSHIDRHCKDNNNTNNPGKTTQKKD